MSQILYQLDDNSLTFPPFEYALTEPNGLLALGGDLSPERLLAAYGQGIFPWYSDGDPLMWWSPDPRAIINIEQLRINRTLRKAIKKSPFKITLNQSFEQVIQYCADAPFRNDETWIVDEMQTAYLTLHQLGYAHSIEVWQTIDTITNEQTSSTKQLVGGLYGVAINGFFSGESMFYQQPNASKFALAALGKLLASIDISFIDCQLLNPFLEDMGAIEITRDAFLQKQRFAKEQNVPDNFWRARTLTL
ncbi:leucyl/phenylalanyl-tRNA--protein transferase [Colwellia sp. E2M01]|uniref:leucyl/phenylalanyl-tRNA--protein transferase n=1 Tax=Colwellia sp. E2M01 TaxID=2841561 RepID=UPI001C086B84|nr:leucyl/phenylalanyl-tRNA--protein transferase [Colwellia sp. E2M01]MBU2870517.1 leucyl/phenylalanyl-tRNA--protein transferase [Colwellia sp. E2M01]